MINKQSKIYLDASFLLALFDSQDSRHEKTIDVKEYIINKQSKCFDSTITFGEVVNRLIFKLFLLDMRFNIDIEPLNTEENISGILGYFDEKEIDIIIKGIECEFNKVKFRKHFNYIYKKGDKNLLKIYFESAISIYDDLRKQLNIDCLPVNNNMVENCKQFIEKHVLDVNDAQNIAISLGHRMNYILTLDGDYESVLDSLKINILNINDTMFTEDNSKEEEVALSEPAKIDIEN